MRKKVKLNLLSQLHYPKHRPTQVECNNSPKHRHRATQVERSNAPIICEYVYIGFSVYMHIYTIKLQERPFN